MIIHRDTLISEDILEQQFCCDLHACKGACCVEGDAGAPLEVEELGILDDIWEEVLPYLSSQGKKAIAKHGRYLQDLDGEWVTPLIEGNECAYTVFDGKGIAQCGIELAYQDGKTSFQKPVSCHLYPIRLGKVGDYESVNYHQWSICKAACILGEKLKLPVFRFLKDPLIRKYGEQWYHELEDLYGVWRQEVKKK
jgi:hypothetical protein